jgi:hypothetical protein
MMIQPSSTIIVVVWMAMLLLLMWLSGGAKEKFSSGVSSTTTTGSSSSSFKLLDLGDLLRRHPQGEWARAQRSTQLVVRLEREIQLVLAGHREIRRWWWCEVFDRWRRILLAQVSWDSEFKLKFEKIL